MSSATLFLASYSHQAYYLIGMEQWVFWSYWTFPWRRVIEACFGLLLVWVSTPSHGEPILRTGVLEITGAIEGGSPKVLDLESIRSLPAVAFDTFDPWDQRLRSYRGTRITAILDLIGLAPGAKEVEVVATNGYHITIPLSDLHRYHHILSYEMDGLPFDGHDPAFDKGPLAIAIDFEASGAEPELYKHHMAWWVTKLMVR